MILFSSAVTNGIEVFASLLWVSNYILYSTQLITNAT